MRGSGLRAIVSIAAISSLAGCAGTSSSVRAGAQWSARSMRRAVPQYLEDSPASVPQEWITKGQRRARAAEAEAPFAETR